MKKTVSIIGCTGSIGCQAAEVVKQFPHRLEIVGLAAGTNIPMLIKQIDQFQPKVVSVATRELVQDLQDGLRAANIEYHGEILWGQEGLLRVATYEEAQIVLTSVTGTVGLVPTIAAIKAGKDIALANKETLVAAGELVTSMAHQIGVEILPVDSEHSALFQASLGNRPQDIDKLILTASGGPFRGKTRAELTHVTLDMALNHPNWSMGKKITIDSATLMNKGLEVIEAHWLFHIPYSAIEVVVHPQSIIHSMVEYKDGAVIAQMGTPDMRLPIQYALSYPERWTNPFPRLDFRKMANLTFEQPDFDAFPALAYAYEAGKIGGTMPAALNAANEQVVGLFLERKVSFLDITSILYQVMENHIVVNQPCLESILDVDQWARQEALKCAQKIIG